MTLAVADLQRLSSLLDEALDLSASDRTLWLAALPDAARPLAGTLRELLAKHAEMEPGSFTPTPEVLLGEPSSRTGAPVIGAQVGPYRLLRELGKGGMGSVWLAERADGSLRRKVALKLPHLGWSASLAERFARERDILSTLEHPHIARLYDAGVDALGRPYMALEYVEGHPIDQYCSEHRLDVRARLRLLLHVAEAVAFAHTRLVIHRDLKPGNILVTEQGQARLLDFGIAKLMEGDRARETALTQAAGRALTLDYASPEQIRGDPVSTASDVYSLGVVAYELLAGLRPYRLERGSAAELEEAIAAVDAPLASATATEVAARKELKGDLDAILNKSLKKAPAERYATVDALAQDIERFLSGHRVIARPDSLAYRLTRFAKRYRTPLTAAAITVIAFGLAIGLGATALIILALLLGLGAALWQARKAREQAEIAREQSRIAQTEAKTAEAVQAFLEGIFRTNTGDQVDPIKARQRTAIQLLDEGAAQIVTSLDDEPKAKLRVLDILADMYQDLWEQGGRSQLLGQRVRLQARVSGELSEEHLLALAEWADALVDASEEDQAEAALNLVESVVSGRPQTTAALRCKLDLALANLRVTGCRQDELAPAERAVAALRAVPASPDLIRALELYGKALDRAGRHAEALETLHDALELASAQPRSGSRHSWLLGLIGDFQASAGDDAAAEASYRQAIERADCHDGPLSRPAALARSDYADFLGNTDRPLDGVRVAEDALRIVSTWPEDSTEHERYGPALSLFLARIQFQAGRPAQALALIDSAHALVDREASLPSFSIFWYLDRADALIALRQFDRAADALSATRALSAKHGLSESIGARIVTTQMAIEIERGQFDEVQRLWASLSERPLTAKQRLNLRVLHAELELARGQPQVACAEFDAVLAEVVTRPRSNKRLQARLNRGRGEALLVTDRVDEARAALQTALSALTEIEDESCSPTIASVRQLIMQASTAVTAGHQENADPT
jgi:tetratricopeptide (TPR) repeat protein